LIQLKRWIFLACTVCVLSATACTPPGPQTPTAPETGIIVKEPVTLTILYTNDEHGWMAGEEDHGGAASMMHLWTEEEGYTMNRPFLILSGGDTWTGPAISTWFDGESMIEVMNEMGYDAAAIGNHEFDYGIPGLEERSAQATFPFLSANIQNQRTGEQVGFALPYVIEKVNGIDVGIIGLSTLSTPKTTMPTYVEGLDFVPYAAALEKAVSQARADGAQIIVVIAHICSFELLGLVPKASQLGIAMIGGGHCHERFSQVVDGVALVEAGSNLRAYGRIDLTYNPSTESVMDVNVRIISNNNAGQDSDVAALVASWQEQIDAELQHVIGYTKDGIEQGSNAMFNMVMDAWLAAYPADVAICNPGSFRQNLIPGDVSLADVVGMLPFDNYLVDVELTGAQLITSVNHGSRRPALGGMTTKGGYKLMDGTPIDRSATYHVLVNNFMYAGGDGYQFAEYNPDVYETGIDWRQPVIDWIIAQKTDLDHPLEEAIDTSQR
jgi:5'-nucleotidase/UDP-sugar diphosphatase